MSIGRRQQCVSVDVCVCVCMDVYVCVCVCILLSPSFRSLLVNHCLVAVEVDVPRFKLHISISIQILLRSLQLLEHLQLLALDA